MSFMFSNTIFQDISVINSVIFIKKIDSESLNISSCVFKNITSKHILTYNSLFNSLFRSRIYISNTIFYKCLCDESILYINGSFVNKFSNVHFIQNQLKSNRAEMYVNPSSDSNVLDEKTCTSFSLEKTCSPNFLCDIPRCSCSNLTRIILDVGSYFILFYFIFFYLFYLFIFFFFCMRI
jgi:hypothetical protein